MKNYKTIESEEIILCPADDRLVYIERTYGEITGLNFMQGDEIDYFKVHYCEANEQLTKFYNAIRRCIIGTSELDRINEAIWAYVRYRND